jgi:hypothetical protein
MSPRAFTSEKIECRAIIRNLESFSERPSAERSIVIVDQ